MMPIRIIGDVHGKYIPYAKICKDAELKELHTLQLGDMGFSYGHFKHFGLEPDRHMFFGGNHDNYEVVKECPNNIGDFGLVPGHTDLFFTRGAYSIDKAQRVEGRDWWHEEEMRYGRCLEALDMYGSTKPSIVVTHDCPTELITIVTNSCHKLSTRTGQLLQQMFDSHSQGYGSLVTIMLIK